jgi:NTE family protein
MPHPHHVEHPEAPVRPLAGESLTSRLEDGLALCLSGGGYRAMVFHVGAILRLNEAQLLPKLKRVSSVSGGSITAGVLGHNWKKLHFANGQATNLTPLLVDPIRLMASKSIDAGSVVGGILSPFSTIGDRIAAAYDGTLFNGATLQDLPADDKGPRFVINATSVQTGALCRFSRSYIADYQVGMIKNPTLPLARAVAASSAFPPVLSPVNVDVDPSQFDPATRGPLFKDPYNDTFVLTDGGVYDNMGIETAWKRCKTVLVSDAGAPFAPDPEPDADWGRHVYRILGLIDNQVRALRRRQIIAAFQDANEPHDGAYWGIGTDIANYQLPNVLNCPLVKTQALAQTPTRLSRLSRSQQDRLMNWGYAVCDAALRKHAAKHLPANFPAPGGFPFQGGVG